jgi:hypothetical protein
MFDRETGSREARMRGRLVAMSGVLALGYLLSPFVTLYRLQTALCDGDARFVDQHVDWPQVRDGIIDEVGAEIRGDKTPSATSVASEDLPPFGTSFVQGMAGHLVDGAMRHETILATLRQLAEGGGAGDTPAKPPSLNWAFFDGPTSFNAEWTLGGGATAQRVRLHLALIGDRWRVTQASLPLALLASNQPHT